MNQGYDALRHETPKNRDQQPVRRSARTTSSKTIRKVTSPLKNGNIKTYLNRTGNDHPPILDLHASKVHPPSLDDYKVDGLFDDVEMQDAPDAAVLKQTSATAAKAAPDTASGAFDYDESVEETYRTPPESPSKIRLDPSRPHTTQQLWSPKRFSIQGGDSRGSSDTIIPQGRKRSFPPPAQPEVPYKVSRDASESRFTSVYPAQPSQGLRYIGDPEFNKTLLENQKSFGSLHKSWSTESLSSVTSSVAAKPLSAWTTPNTSFLVETPATSFDSSVEPYELDHLREKQVHARRSWQNLKAPFGLGLEMGIDHNSKDGDEVVPMGPPAPVPKYKSPPGVSVKRLLSDSPFGKKFVASEANTLTESKALRNLVRMLLHICGSCTRSAASRYTRKDL